MTLACKHDVTLSNVPSSRLRLPNIDKPASFADWYPCSIDNSFGDELLAGPVSAVDTTFPNGPAIEPSRF